MRSTHVAIGAIGALVLSLCACGAFSEDRHCVDSTDKVVDDSRCENGSAGARWYYGGTYSGGKMSGGSYERGGFGRLFSGSHGS